MRMAIDPNEKTVKQIVSAAYPDYKGKKVSLHTTDAPVNVQSCWQGGSRSYFVFVRLDNMLASGEVPAQSAFDRPILGAEAVSLPRGVVCVERHFYGSQESITIHCPAESVNGLALPAPVQVSREEEIVLVATRQLKSSYAGIPNYRLHEARRDTGITTEQWEAAKAGLIVRGLLDKRGALTIAGRNAAGSKQLHEYRPTKELATA
jgi:hypothetical protein